MIQDVYMEVLDDSEAMQYCYSNNIPYNEVFWDNDRCYLVISRYTDISDYTEIVCGNIEKLTGAMATGAMAEQLMQSEYNNISTEIYLVGTNYNNGIMYVSDRTKCSTFVTFSVSMAKKLTKEKAIRKAYCMNKSGKYNWRAMKLRW